MYGNEVSAFHRKYRSKTFKEYMGNDKMKKQLMRAFKAVTLPQVILMTGTSGGGKTTMSRLIAKEYLCRERHEELGACNQCDNCELMDQFIESGDWRSILQDVQEVDATAQGGKADIDALMEEMERPSMEGNWRVFILDECHEIPKAAQNRLLKTLEEPPEKVLILLATTDPQKLLPTILTRCQYDFEVSKPNLKEATPLLTTICEKEGVPYDIKAFNLMCVKADFVPRQILVNLDKTIQQTGKATYDATVEVMDMVADDLYFEFFGLLLAEHIDIYKYVSLISRVKDTVGMSAFVNELIPFTKRGIYILVGAKVMGLDKSEIDLYNRIFGKLSTADISDLLSVLVELKASLDPETLLLYVGYHGIRKKEEPKAEPMTVIPNNLANVFEENNTSRENFQKHGEVTEEEREEIIRNARRPLTLEELAGKVGGTVVTMQDSNQE